MRKILAVTIVLAAPLLGGGFWLEIGNGKASKDPRAGDAAVIVRVLGCHEPAKAQVSGWAEGLVKGQRQRVALELAPLGQPGTYAVKRTWPRDGVWVLSLAGSADGLKTGAVVRVGAEGFERGALKHMQHHPTSDEVSEALQTSH